MAVDTSRHISVFDPDKVNFSKTKIHIIGCGATGSKVARALADLGIETLHLWDFDKVEIHNIANQEFRNGDVGKSKVSALAEIIKEKTGLSVETHDEKVTDQRLDGYVFLLTDTMASRKEIFENSLKYKPNTKMVFETRMGTDTGMIYSFCSYKPSHIKKWLDRSDYGDDEAEVSACGTSISVGMTAAIIANLAVWQFIKAFTALNGGEEEFKEHEILFQIRPTFNTLLNVNFDND